MRVILFVGLAFILFGVWWGFVDRGEVMQLMEPQVIGAWIRDLGPAGPMATAGLMAFAIVFSPLPSAPIALAAGAVYGHTWGTIYILVGAQIGALIAFWIARYFGKDAVDRLVGGRLPKTFIGTQNGLTGIVLVARLIPFLSFDAVSYAAGLTPLTVTRFAVATFIGMVPVSFLLTHFGAELSAANWGQSMTALLVMAVLMLVPVVILAARKRKRRLTQGEEK